MKKEVNGKMEKVSEFRGGGGGRSFGGARPAGFSRPSGGGFARPMGRVVRPAGSVTRPIGGMKPTRNHPASFHPNGYRPRNYRRGYRRPFWGVGGGWLVWNGVYWIDPMGVCYFENDYGDYVQANCIAHDPIAQLQPDVLLFTGVDGKKSETPKPAVQAITKGEMDNHQTPALASSEDTLPRPFLNMTVKQLKTVGLVAALAVSAFLVYKYKIKK